jgi:nucleotide-binding universal stress UspA family protein
MKILLAVDFSSLGRRTTGAGYRLAQKIASEVTFFHCAPQASRFLQGYDIKAFVSSTGKEEQKNIEDAAKLKLHKVMEDVIAENGIKEGLRIEEKVVSGEPADEILSYAESNKFDLIFLGYKSFNLIEQILVGSTADKVIRYATCSVLIYRPDRAEHIDL